jgi:hypothetical protein
MYPGHFLVWLPQHSVSQMRLLFSSFFGEGVFFHDHDSVLLPAFYFVSFLFQWTDFTPPFMWPVFILLPQLWGSRSTNFPVSSFMLASVEFHKILNKTCCMRRPHKKWTSIHAMQNNGYIWPWCMFVWMGMVRIINVVCNTMKSGSNEAHIAVI